MSLFSLRRLHDPPARPPTEREVLTAAEEFIRKEKLVDRFSFLPSEMNKTAKDAALHRFLEVLFRHVRW